MNYFNKNTDEVLKALETTREAGLTASQMEESREKYGANIIAEEKPKSK